jgi:predicted tellurium resistance membrane protein TerC
MEWITDPNAWLAFGTLTVLEIVLGIDNIIFITILAGKLPEEQRARARVMGLALAMITRIALLFSLTWLMSLNEPFFTVLAHPVSGRDLILIIGGLFLLGKSTVEIHDKLEGFEAQHNGNGNQSGSGTGTAVAASFTSVLVQIALLDIVFSLDSVITAIGLADDIGIMVSAIVIAVIAMMVFVGPVSDFVDRHPTFKMLALSFLLLIGFALVGEGLAFHVPKGYLYFAMGFSAFVEFLNIKIRKSSSNPIQFKSSTMEP